MRGLRRHVDGGLAGHRVHVGHDPAGLQRRGVRARVVGGQRHHPVRAGEGGLGGGLVAGLPRVGQVVGLALLLVADQLSALRQGLLGRGDGVEHLVVDLDQLGPVGGRVRVGGDDRGHLLALVADLVGGQHGLGVARQGRHPGQVVGGHQLAGHHGQHAVHRCRSLGVDAVDARVGHRRAHQRHVQHPGQCDVVEEVSLALDEPGVLHPLDAVADAADLGRRRRCVSHCVLPFSCRRWTTTPQLRRPGWP